MEQTKALNALEPFLALLPTASTPRQQADLITRATSAPNTYLFAPLLTSPSIQSLASTEFSPHLSLLNIFSTSTYQTYLTTPNLPPLSPAQSSKLRQLSLLSLAKDRNLTYPSLLTSLNLSNPAELEDLVRKSIYAGLIKATLDPRGGLVHVHSVAPLRDVAPQSIPSLLSSLSAWATRCDSALSDLADRVGSVRAAADARAKEKEEWDARVKKLVEDEKSAAEAARSAEVGWFEAPGYTLDGAGGGSGSGGDGGRSSRGVVGGEGSGRGLPARHGQGGGGGAKHGGQRYGKRGSGHMEGGDEGDGVDDEAMDLDEVDEVGGQKKASRRKL
ncbi:PCI domain-containing protein [Coniochaeta sp. 2T2.1]|nr:PCI domain-containing protein [Coniochaeta sp. 2T2.1]